jgi:hypothetical protein
LLLTFLLMPLLTLMSDTATAKETGVKTNGAITRNTMASGRKSTGKKHVRNDRPRVHSPAGVARRAKVRATHYEPRASTCEGRFMKGYKRPGSMNPRKVGR